MTENANKPESDFLRCDCGAQGASWHGDLWRLFCCDRCAMRLGVKD